MTTIAERTGLPHVLLIDDNHGDAILTRLAFKKAKMTTRVTIAQTAEIAISLLRDDDGKIKRHPPDVILLDLNLPLMSGLAFLKLIKADPVLRLIPVIALSSSKADNDIRAAYQTYVNGFITKPFSMEDYGEIVSTVEDYWFKLVETQPVDPAPASLSLVKQAT